MLRSFLVFLALTLALPAHAGSVTVNGLRACTDTPSFTMSTTGDLNVTCGGTTITPPPPSTSCSTHATVTSQTVVGQQQYSIPFNGTMAGPLPISTKAGETILISPVQVVGQSTRLTVQFSISPCPGYFPSVPPVPAPHCTAWGTVYGGAVRISARTVDTLSSGTPAACEVEVGRLYYLNARFIDYYGTGLSPGCTSGTCWMWLNNGG